MNPKEELIIVEALEKIATGRIAEGRGILEEMLGFYTENDGSTYKAWLKQRYQQSLITREYEKQ